MTQARTVKMVKMAHRVRKDHRGFKVLWANKVFPVSQDLREFKALLARMEPANQ